MYEYFFYLIIETFGLICSCIAFNHYNDIFSYIINSFLLLFNAKIIFYDSLIIFKKYKEKYHPYKIISFFLYGCSNISSIIIINNNKQFNKLFIISLSLNIFILVCRMIIFSCNNSSSEVTIVNITLKPYNTIKSNEECPICYNNICNVSTECKHKFCQNCIDKWLEKNITCPICVTPLYEVVYKNIPLLHRQILLMRKNPKNPMPEK